MTLHSCSFLYSWNWKWFSKVFHFALQLADKSLKNDKTCLTKVDSVFFQFRNFITHLNKSISIHDILSRSIIAHVCIYIFNLAWYNNNGIKFTTSLKTGSIFIYWCCFCEVIPPNSPALFPPSAPPPLNLLYSSNDASDRYFQH